MGDFNLGFGLCACLMFCVLISGIVMYFTCENSCKESSIYMMGIGGGIFGGLVLILMGIYTAIYCMIKNSPGAKR